MCLAEIVKREIVSEYEEMFLFKIRISVFGCCHFKRWFENGSRKGESDFIFSFTSEHIWSDKFSLFG